MGCGGSKPEESSTTATADPKDVVVTGTITQAASTDGVPQRVKAFFHRLDLDSDHRVSLEELQGGFDKEVKDLKPHAKEAITTLFEAHTQAADDGKKYLKPGSFNRFYAEILFKHFDANDNGYLELEEAQEALRFLTKKKEGEEKPAVHAAFPADAYVEGELRLPKAWFFKMYRSMV